MFGWDSCLYELCLFASFFFFLQWLYRFLFIYVFLSCRVVPTDFTYIYYCSIAVILFMLKTYTCHEKVS